MNSRKKWPNVLERVKKRFKLFQKPFRFFIYSSFILKSNHRNQQKYKNK
jgi:hypothetical protein